jgi:hypothetical protein
MRLLDRALESTTTANYPATTADLVAAHGDTDLELPNGTETVGDVLRRLPAQTYSDKQEMRTALYGALSTKGVGRVGYSDRNPVQPGEDGPDQVSL